MNVTFANIEDSRRLLGKNQCGIYVDGNLQFYATKFGNNPKIRVFTFPENVDMHDFSIYLNAKTIEEIKNLDPNIFLELIKEKQNADIFFINVIFTNGLKAIVDREHLEQGTLTFVNYGGVSDVFTSVDIEKLKKLLTVNCIEMEDVDSVVIINCRNYLKETIHPK
ncbi:MAG: hypothetical protein ACRCVV_10095 [Shewanella sp.]